MKKTQERGMRKKTFLFWLLSFLSFSFWLSSNLGFWLLAFLNLALVLGLGFNGLAQDQARPKLVRWFKDNSYMILIPAGEFWMGADKSVNVEYMAANEKPKHKVFLPDYYIDKFEVTNQQYFNFCKETGHKLPLLLKEGAIPAGRENHPVVNITWDDADAFCKWAGKRLPTEAEWEKAGRGTDARTYPWGNGWDQNLCNNRTSPYEDTVPVGTYPKGASPYGVMDMAGNAWEWTEDWYKSYPGAPNSFDETGKMKVTRGGAYFYSIFLLLVTSRHPLPPDDRSEYNGFRCAVSADGVKISPSK